VRIRINSDYWGEEYAAHSDTPPTCTGQIDRWDKASTKDTLYVMWEGYARNQKAPLDKMENASSGTDLELTLLPFSDGSPPPELEVRADKSDDEVMEPMDDGPGDDEDDGESDQQVDVNGQKWTPRPRTYVTVDGRQQPDGSPAARYKPSLNTGGKTLDSIEAYFYHFMPEEWVDLVINNTNPFLDGRDDTHKKLTRGELLRFFGYMISLSVHKGIPLEKMWSRTPPPDSTAEAPAMGRYGINQNRFDKLRSIFRSGPADDASFDANDWCFVDGLVDAFNKNRKEGINPGWLLAPDESMSAWRGKVGKRDTKKCPHRMFVRRKPEPLGVELKDMGDALSGCMLFLEITKGKAEVIKPKYWVKGEACAATTLRMSENWFGTNRCVAADSWFASVRTAERMWENGLHFTGDVKTGTSRFPLKALKDATPQTNGAWAVYTSTLTIGGDKTIPIFSVSHRRGESIHGFISTCGTTLPGNAHLAYFEDDEERAMGEISEHEVARDCPRVLNDFTLAQPTVDRHNRYRQHILAMEKRLVTNNFNFRFFTTLLGMVAVDAFFALRYWKDPRANFLAEMDRLALRLMNNPDAPQSKAADGSPPAKHASRSPEGACPDGQHHRLMRLGDVEGVDPKSGKGTRQERCIMCNKHTVWVCATCTEGAHALVPVCPEITRPRKGELRGCTIHHPCLGQHRCNPLFFPKGKRASGGKRKKAAAADGGCESMSEGEGEDEEC
jgi:hypothetical protein